ncbi:(deoxy)nucleoside triphosphate pyrophosphohydrolase [Aneurinibacillus sp. Ricciae_BoGa-3]|uniref:(deoxy)nucleoside triphosphate pyrophosphohydrolase n=1 Tax=Aneurinibacillus sp. Ricciae_BoGa-3 TaxID=3022697 RepID=UPI0023424926|nr:(deoxy)nucleoside triphosphate pyrophosphohydrolase [Aneurinibacillus sp. Ricciae_BoGa-3]WCK55263.1 (deoxy)nucleoside triphosphate pyrophosphohydrolase [Aneurinibacillus sp. Ricciae_BoGa-3]
MNKVNVVGAVIVNDSKQILCALRSQQMSQPGLWEFPGGKIEPGETPEMALKREIAEELGVEIKTGQQIADFTYQYPGITVRLLTFYAELADSKAVVHPTEHEKFQWLECHQLQKLKWAPADIPTVNAICLQHSNAARAGNIIS